MHIKFSGPFICNRFPSELNFSSKQIETKEKSIRLNFTPINISGFREEFQNRFVKLSTMHFPLSLGTVVCCTSIDIRDRWFQALPSAYFVVIYVLRGFTLHIHNWHFCLHLNVLKCSSFLFADELDVLIQ